MAGYAIGKSMNLGFPGTFARTPDDVIMSRPVKSDSDPIPFGAPVLLNSDNTYALAGATATLAAFAGIAVRIVKQTVEYLNQSEAAYQPQQAASVIERGNVTVKCNVGTPTAGGKVYVRVVANEAIAAGVVGGLEAEADSTNTIELTNCRWATGIMDANRVVELCIMTRNNP